MRDRFFLIPALILPSEGEEIIQLSLDQAWCRTIATRQFINGEISPDDFDEVLFETGCEPYVVRELWEEGVSFGYG